MVLTAGKGFLYFKNMHVLNTHLNHYLSFMHGPRLNLRFCYRYTLFPIFLMMSGISITGTRLQQDSLYKIRTGLGQGTPTQERRQLPRTLQRFTSIRPG